MANERTPDDPLPVDFVPEESVATHRVSDGENWTSVAAKYNVNVKDLIYFNFHTNVPEEINWYLRRNTGCNVSKDGGRNWAFSSSADPGLIYIPPSEVIDMEPEDVTVRDDSQAPTDNASFADELPAEIDRQSRDVESTQSDEETSQDAVKDERMEGDTGGAPQKSTKTGDCSGWEGMPDIFAKRLADHYIRTELGTEPARLKSISGGPSTESTRSLVYDDGVEIWVILKYIPDHVIAMAMRPLPEKQRCTYDYDCINPPSGPQLVFTKRSCDHYPP